MARAIPGLLGVIPVHDTIEMRAHRGSLVEVPALVTVDGDFTAPATDDCPLTRLDCTDIGKLAAGEIILVLLGDIGVLFEVLRCRLDLDARWIIEPTPLV